MNYLPIAIAIAGAVFYYKAAEHENISPVPWVALSVAVSALVLWLGASVIIAALAQLALIPAIALWRVWREDRKEDDA